MLANYPLTTTGQSLSSTKFLIFSSVLVSQVESLTLMLILRKEVSLALVQDGTDALCDCNQSSVKVTNSNQQFVFCIKEWTQ